MIPYGLSIKSSCCFSLLRGPLLQDKSFQEIGKRLNLGGHRRLEFEVTLRELRGSRKSQEGLDVANSLRHTLLVLARGIPCKDARFQQQLTGVIDQWQFRIYHAALPVEVEAQYRLNCVFFRVLLFCKRKTVPGLDQVCSNHKQF